MIPHRPLLRKEVIRRLLVGFREIDIGASLYHSGESALRELMMLFRRSIIHNEGNPDIGRSLAHSLSEAGFNVRESVSSYAQASTENEKSGMYKAMTALWEQADFPGQAVELGWISEEERKTLPERLNLESIEPGSFCGTTYVESIAFDS